MAGLKTVPLKPDPFSDAIPGSPTREEKVADSLRKPSQSCPSAAPRIDDVSETMKLPFAKFADLPGTCYAVIALALFSLNSSAQAVDMVNYKGVVVPFLDKHCTGCHDDDDPKADLDLYAIDTDFDKIETVRLWQKIYEQVQYDEMPPEKKKRPDAAALQKAIQWISSELNESGHGTGLEEKLLLPEYANYMSHELLFNGSIKTKAYTPARLWRTRPFIYEANFAERYGKKPRQGFQIGGTGGHTVKEGEHAGKTLAQGRAYQHLRYANPFFQFVHHASGITDYSSIVADQASLETLLVNAEKMAAILTVGRAIPVSVTVKDDGSKFANNPGSFAGGAVTGFVKNVGLIKPAFIKVLNTKEAPSAPDINKAVQTCFNLLLHRDGSPEEVRLYVDDLFKKNLPYGNLMALQSVLIAMAISPEFVYRLELGMGEKDSYGRHHLSEHELVYALNYSLFNKPPFADFDYLPKDKQKLDSPDLPDADDLLYYANNKMPEHPLDAPEDMELINTTLKKFVMNPRNSASGLGEVMKAGKLKTKEDVERELRRLLSRKMFTRTNSKDRPAHTIGANPRILQFFREFFGYHHAPNVFKDEKRFDYYTDSTPRNLVSDTDQLILYLVDQDENVLENMLTTNISFFNTSIAKRPLEAALKAQEKFESQKSDGELSPVEKLHNEHYTMVYNVNLGSAVKSTEKPFSLPKAERIGILTQPSWLVAHSNNFENDPVRRGKWIREKLLAGFVLDIPINVDANVPEDEHKTLRERFTVVEADECWRCHKKMNPLGMPFEAYYDSGRFRTEEKGKEVVTSGAISYSGEEGLDGEVQNVSEMMWKLAKSKRVKQSFVRHAFRFFMGRNEMLSDSQTLIDAEKAYLDNNGSFKEMLISLLTSDSFLYRK